MKKIGMGMTFLGIAFLLGCATPAVVFISPGYNPNQTQKVALLTFDDCPGQPGSGGTVSDIFANYLLKMNYQLVDRSQVDSALQQQNATSADQLDPSQMSALGKLLGVDAFVLGSVSAYTDTSEQTVMVDTPQEETDPIYGEVTTRQHTPGQTVVTQQQVVTGYSTTFVDQSVPQTETLPATVGLSARLVSASTHSVLWSGSGSADGMNLSSAAQNASSKVIQALQKDLQKPGT